MARLRLQPLAAVREVSFSAPSACRIVTSPRAASRARSSALHPRAPRSGLSAICYVPTRKRRLVSFGLRRSKALSANRIWPAWSQRLFSFRPEQLPQACPGLSTLCRGPESALGWFGRLPRVTSRQNAQGDLSEGRRDETPTGRGAAAVAYLRSGDHHEAIMRILSVWVIELIKFLGGRRLHSLNAECPICHQMVRLHYNHAGRRHLLAHARACSRTLYEGARFCAHYSAKIKCLGSGTVAKFDPRPNENQYFKPPKSLELEGL